MKTPFTYPPSSAPVTGAAVYDGGLRRHMLGVYRNMALGLGITALVALLVASTPGLYQPIFGTPLKWAAIFAPLAFVLFFSFRVERMTIAQARMAFYAFAGVMGVSMASIFLVFTDTSIALAFASAAAVFAGMSLWGYTTRIDLSRWSTFLMVGLIGVVIASLVNLVVGSSTLQLVFSIAGVLVFTGLTAWDTQRLKSEYLAYAGSERADKLAVMGALSLYLNLINLFQLLLGLFGQREE
ncbi:Bax inhibitor-1/YccA family protein [Sphingobium scionense]|mgnify:CR=1 FL=1|jgi:FtsH-binding integral membrane protein|uniref:Bax inhibitor-1/YccA family protein n=2 Tax=Sphingobium yanoikuyae TaxID=13690 RepID=A0AA43BEN9_SPHYA|nr:MULTISPECIES: Bax inhibitor-1/YccA family protein [Sphingobium]MDF0542867.1 Bax inhibitor-1/YccA family protein [Sphingobium arseniciresistens]MDH2133977.1 Bax inhibitor-1/YccA family protein [Sphingobium yanoikuyae]MDH2151770.1 Bax inhibitor-1/YccA family protein [Sphingobium yanoikuyae]MDH2169321.1 Bax inhibitor-1/YccA family protein [Sphingobium yanoikuyae]